MKWISVTERLPEFSDVQIFIPFWNSTYKTVCFEIWDKHVNIDRIKESYTHWLEITGPDEKDKCEKCIFHERYGCSTMALLRPTKDDPFRRVNLRVVDFSHSDNCYVLEEPEDFCTWTYDEFHCYWDRDCILLQPFSLSNDDGLQANNIHHCPNCGRIIKEVKP